MGVDVLTAVLKAGEVGASTLAQQNYVECMCVHNHVNKKYIVGEQLDFCR
jgi:hypothetical protein